jgi:hypothetical protein
MSQNLIAKGKGLRAKSKKNISNVSNVSNVSKQGRLRLR